MSIKIGIDAGHSQYNTPGKQTPDGIKEWVLNDSVADKIAVFLKDYDVEIIRTDNDEGYIDEGDVVRRTTYLNANVDALVSIHHNAFTGTWNKATGVEVWVDRNATSEDMRLANCIYPKLVANTGLCGRGIKKENWTVIYQNKIPAILVEGGFMDSTIDYKVITSDVGQTAYAKAVADGLVEFFGLKKTISTTPSVPNKLSVGDKVKLVSGAKYTSGTSVPTWVINSTLYVREIRNNGDVVISTLKTGAITGVVNSKYLTKNNSSVVIENNSGSTSAPSSTAPSISNELKLGDKIKLVSGAKYTTGGNVPAWVINSTLYVREIQGSNVVVSTQRTGAITGVVSKQYISGQNASSGSDSVTATLKLGDKVKLVSGAKYTSGGTIPTWVINSTLYVRDIQGNNVVISTLKTGAITGVVTKNYLIKI